MRASDRELVSQPSRALTYCRLHSDALRKVFEFGHTLTVVDSVTQTGRRWLAGEVFGHWQRQELCHEIGFFVPGAVRVGDNYLSSND